MRAAFQGRSATQLVSVNADYRGVWVGSTVLTTCNDSGELAAINWCQQLGGVGASLPATLAFRDRDPSLHSLDGTLAVGSVPFSLLLVPTGTGPDTATCASAVRTTPPFAFEFEDPVFYNRGCSATLQFTDRLTGSWKALGNYASGKGYVNLEGNFAGLTKNSSLTFPETNSYPAVSSLTELIGRLKH